MTPIIEDAVLGTDLDCQFQDLLNVKSLVPVPVNLVTTDHPALSDPRPPALGSVTNESVADDAAIIQSKLSLDGQIPTAWLGTDATTAAQGDLAEYLSNKNQPGGYAGLDPTGKVPESLLPATTGTGTVTSVDLTMPAEFTVTGTPVTGAGTIDVAWSAVADLSWFGNMEGSSGPPQFYTDPVPPSLIPALDASKVTTGVFDPDRLPVATSDAPGAVPVPGLGDGPGESPDDYLSRGMTYLTVPDSSEGPAYEPTLPDPVLTRSGEDTDPRSIIIDIVDGDGVSIIDEHMVFFYSLTSDTEGFIEFPATRFIDVAIGDPIWAYAAHAGYKNSSRVTIEAV